MTTALSTHFSLEELTVSQTAARKGLNNTPPPPARANLVRLANLLEQVRSLLGNHPVIVSSGYRSESVNAAIKGAKKSAHMRGLAADFTVPGYGSVADVARAISSSSLDFDQLILEYGSWVHLSCAAEGARPRRQVLSTYSGTDYLEGLVT